MPSQRKIIPRQMNEPPRGRPNSETLISSLGDDPGFCRRKSCVTAGGGAILDRVEGDKSSREGYPKGRMDEEEGRLVYY